MVRGCRLRIYDSKHRLRIILLLVVVLLAGRYQRAGAVSKGIPTPKSIPQRQLPAKAAGPVSKAAKVITASCEKIAAGSFEGAREVLEASDIPQSIGIVQLGMIVAEYEAIEAGRKASRNDMYTKQIDELEKLRQKDQPKDVNDIGQVFLTIVKASEHAEENKKKAFEAAG